MSLLVENQLSAHQRSLMADVPRRRRIQPIGWL